MNQNIEIALKQAFSLIEAEQLEDARAILRPILESEKDNADVWWVYSHAVTDADTARLALNNVLRLEPNYPGAHELFDQLDAQEKVEDLEELGEIGREPSFVPTLPTTMPGILALPSRQAAAVNLDDADDFLDDDDISGDAEDAFYRRPLFYVPLISLLVILALAIVIFKPFSVSSPTVPTLVDATAESVVALPTPEQIGTVDTTSLPTPTLASEVEPTSVPSQSDVDFSVIKTALAQFNLPADGGVVVEDTALGRTIVSTICTTAGKEMRALLPQVMVELAKVSGAYVDRSDAVAVRMSDCATNSTLLEVGAPIADANAFASGSTTEQAFQATWKPI